MFILLRTVYYILIEEGLTGLIRRLRGARIANEIATYEDFRKKFEPPALKVDSRTTFDILLVPRAERDVIQALDTLQAQTYPHWRLLVISKTASHPLTFETIEAASKAIDADYVMWLEPGDQLAVWALETFAAAAKDRPDVIYCDVDEVGRRNPLFKPDWSPALMLSTNLLRECVVQKPLALAHLQCLPDTGEYGFRVAESANNIQHVPHVLVHHAQTEPLNPDAVKRHLIRIGVIDPQVTVEQHHIRAVWQPVKAGLISVIIPSKDKADLLGKCLDSLYEKTAAPHFEVIVVDTGSVEPETAALYERYAGQIKIVEYREPFNFSKACNMGAKAASGDFLLFLNNDIEVIHEDWLLRMSQWFDLPDVGAVGAKLLFPDGRIQHAGVLVGYRGMAENLLVTSPENYTGPYGSDFWYRDLLAVTGACVLVSCRVFEQVGGFDEQLTLVFNDVFLCLDIYQAGYRIIYTPDARLVHHESATRTRDESTIPANNMKLAAKRFAQWRKTGNPYHSRNLSYRTRIPTFRKYRYDN